MYIFFKHTAVFKTFTANLNGDLMILKNFSEVPLRHNLDVGYSRW